MTVYRRGAMWWVKFQQDGVRHVYSAQTTDKRQAQEYERKLRAQLQEDRFRGIMGRPIERTFREAVLRWEEVDAPWSMRSHTKVVREALGDQALHSILPAVEVMAREQRKAGLSPLTVNRRLAVVRKVLHLAYKHWGWLAEPLHLKIQTYSEKGSAREVYLTAEQCESLLAHLEGEARRAVLIAIYTGLRKGEIFGLTPESVRGDLLLVKGAGAKSKKPRTIPIHPALAPVLAEGLPIRITVQLLHFRWTAAREATGLTEVRFHDLRHTFASWLASDPVIPLGELRDLLGHSSLAVTNKYAHLRASTGAVVARLPVMGVGTKVGTVKSGEFVSA